MSERMTIEEVSEILGEFPHAIRRKCQWDMYDPPICRKVRKADGKQYRYFFYRQMVERYVGNTLPEMR